MLLVENWKQDDGFPHKITIQTESRMASSYTGLQYKLVGRINEDFWVWIRLKVTERSSFCLPDRKFSHDSASRTGVYERLNVQNSCIRILLKYVWDKYCFKMSAHITVLVEICFLTVVKHHLLPRSKLFDSILFQAVQNGDIIVFH
jgi:hypothetical protein